MSRLTSFLIFVSIASLIYFGMHLLIYKVFARSLDLAPHIRKYVKLFLWFSGLMFPFSTLLSRGFHITFLTYYAHTWLGIVAIAFFFALLTWLAVLLAPAHAKTIATVALVWIVSISLFSLVNGLMPPSVKDVQIPIRDLPRPLEGFTVVQLSDLHMEAHKPKKCVSRLVDRVNELKPDLVVLTGDLFDGDLCRDPEYCRGLKKFKATHGVYAVSGNHEFYNGIGNFMKLARESNFTVLRNEGVTLPNGLQLYGVDDRELARFEGKELNLKEVLKNLDPTRPAILLNHRPARFDEAVRLGIDLQLSGHTHAGQIPPMDLLVWLYYKYPAGLYREGNSYIYTSPGTGYWGPPMRFLNHSEITRFTLVKAEE